MHVRLVEDLIPLIIECGEHWWPRDLSNLCKVSSSWLHPARRRLYHYPQLISYRACSLLARSLTENDHLRSLITAVCLRPIPGPNSDSDHSNSTCRAACIESVKTILATDGLRSITLGGDLSIAAGRFLHMVTNPGTVIVLRIDGGLMSHTFRRGPSLEWDEDITLRFVNLRSLHLSNLELVIDVDLSALTCSSVIRTLVLDNVDISHGRLVSIVGAGGVLEHLQVTTLDAPEYDSDIREVLESCEVHSLAYKVKNKNRYRFESMVFDHEMGRLPALREVEMEGVWVDREVVRAVCPGLARLEVVGT
ncbi:hypothetical protein AX15_001140 [Amanita polypyramis BW_CC]|nr:hypothetical protein AX15_001140 [Amanita polypyramis BW_CC]